MKSVRFAGLALGLLAWLAVPRVAMPRDEPRVVALATTGNGQLFLLEGTSGLYAVDTKAQTLRRLPLRFSPYIAADLGVTPAGDQILVSLFLQGSNTLLTRLRRYTLDGKMTGEWSYAPSNSVLWSGAAVDPEGRIAYITNGRRPEVYRVDLTRSGSTSIRWTSVRGAEAVGAIAMDAQRKRLLVADPIGGVLFQVKLDGSSSSMVRGLEEPDALALDAASDRLFVADAETGQVLVVNLAEAVPRARPFSGPIKGLEEPHALALGRDGTVWVADHRSFTLFQLSSSGALLTTIRPKLVTAPARR